jgi:outer membrane protein
MKGGEIMTRSNTVAVALLWVIGITGAATAEELSLDRAVAVALDASHQLEAAEAAAEAAELEVRAAGAEAFPTLTASGSYGSFSGDVFFSRFIPGFPGEGGTDIGPYDKNEVLTVELAQVLYAGGGIRAAKRASRIEGRKSREQLRQARLDLVHEVTRAYSAVLLAEKRLEVAQRSVSRSEAGLDMVRRSHAEQEALEMELLGAEGQLAADRLALMEAENVLQLARLALNRLLGREPATEVQLVDSLESPAEVVDEADGVARAMADSPQVRQAQLDLEHAEAGVGLASALVKPKLELLGIYSQIDNELFFDGDYMGAVLNLSIPFLREAQAGRAATRQARARRRQAEALQLEAESSLRLLATSAYRRLEERNAAVAVARSILEYHRERYRVNLSAYREQLVTYSEVLDQHSELSQAELALYGAHFEARLAEADVRRVIGDPTAGGGDSL